jgi:hypothetical protein
MGLLLGNQYDCQVTEKGIDISFQDPGQTLGLLFARTGAIPSDKGKPGENRGRKVTGLLPPPGGNDRRTSEMGCNSRYAANTCNLKQQDPCQGNLTWAFL